MTEKDVEISEYADALISVPRARVMLELGAGGIGGYADA